MTRTLIALLVFAFVVPGFASAATVSVLPPTRAVTVGDLMTVRVSVNTAGVAINQGEGTLTYPSGLLDVVSVSKSSSIFSLWVGEPANAGAGLITWNGGLPTPGYSGGDGTMLTVVFRAKAAGTGVLALADAAVRANDGLGTDVLERTSPASFTIAAAAVPPPANPVPATPVVTQSSTGVSISSPSHPDQSAWYMDADPVMRWTLPSNADAVQVIAAETPGATPSVTYKASVTEKKVNDLSDGTWYFNLRFRANGVWSAISSYTLHIDTTPPVVENHLFAYDEAARSLSLALTATDVHSGIKGYELVIDDEKPTALSPDTFATGPYLLSFQKSGTHSVSLSIIDRADNRTAITERVVVPVSVLDTKLFAIGPVVVTLLGALLMMALVSIASLLVAIGACYLLVTRHGAPAARRRANRETVHKAFGLMRQDLAKHVRALRKARDGKELTRAEGDLGEEMNANLTDLERYLNEHTDLLE